MYKDIHLCLFGGGVGIHDDVKPVPLADHKVSEIPEDNGRAYAGGGGFLYILCQLP